LTRLVLSAIEEVIKNCNIHLAPSPGRLRQSLFIERLPGEREGGVMMTGFVEATDCQRERLEYKVPASCQRPVRYGRSNNPDAIRDKSSALVALML
jgi:hypothetical protein